jgi:methanogenic corrinoid protein MtbC1
MSISTDRQLDMFRRLMPFIRKQSANPHIRIMAGGPMMSWRPQAMSALGADVVDKDAKQALKRALVLMGR